MPFPEHNQLICLCLGWQGLTAGQRHQRFCSNLICSGFSDHKWMVQKSEHTECKLDPIRPHLQMVWIRPEAPNTTLHIWIRYELYVTEYVIRRNENTHTQPKTSVFDNLQLVKERNRFYICFF